MNNTELLKLTPYVFTNPVHNANIERVFSLIGVHNGTDERNRFQLDILWKAF